jgi:hypothetical protein
MQLPAGALAANCSCEHMPGPDTCPTLQRANDARRRAWRELQRLRRMLALVVDELPPTPKPPSFEAEGALLRAALAKAICEPWRLLARLESAIQPLRPYLSDTRQNGQYPNLLIDLNRALNRPAPTPNTMQKLRELANAGEAPGA